jgi:hypothetical protein
MHTNRVTILAGNTLIFPLDYFAANFAVGVFPVGSTVTVTYTLDDVNIASPAAVYFALPAPFNVGVAANTAAQFSLTIARALKFVVAGGTSCDIMVVQPSGDSTFS